MITLTFAEQVKIVLSRKGMTIKQLAEEIEERAGVKMSRQNLTQRLGRDNFQEKDMRMIAEILECPFHLDILDMEEEVVPVEEVVVKKVIEKKSDTGAKKVVKRIVTEVIEEVKEQEEVEEQEVVEEQGIEESTPEVVPEEVSEEVTYKKSTWPARDAERAKKAKTTKTAHTRDLTMGEVVSNMDVAPDKNKGVINPYTGYEYKTNTVRSHPKRIGYVQVYDRGTHQWNEMTDWAFLGYQEQMKLEKGKGYEEPTYLD